VILTGQTRLRFGSVWFSSVHFGRIVVVVVMLVLNAGLKDLVVQLAIHPSVLKTILI